MDLTSICSSEPNLKPMHLIKFQIASVTIEHPAVLLLRKLEGEPMSDKPVRKAPIENIFATAREDHTNVREQF